MAKGKKKSSNKKADKLEKVLFATAILELVKTVIDLITRFIE